MMHDAPRFWPLLGLLPALLCDDPSRAFVIGWGMGVTTGELAALDEVEEVVTAEISPGVLAAALRMLGRMDEARTHYEAALATHRERAQRRSEGDGSRVPPVSDGGASPQPQAITSNRQAARAQPPARFVQRMSGAISDDLKVGFPHVGAYKFKLTHGVFTQHVEK